MVRAVLFASIACLASALAACGPGRTAAATQTTVVAFDAAASDAQAVAAVDEMTAALGGTEGWAAVKQLRWELKYYQNGELAGWVKHSWDIWNGRHRYEFADAPGLAAYKASGEQQVPVFTIAAYNLFNQGKGFVTNSAIEGTSARGAMSADRDRIIAESYKAWQRDAYQLTMIHKLKDPGVKLEYAGEREDFGGKCVGGCLDIKVTFDPAVGTDLYHVFLDKQSKMPEVIEKNIGGSQTIAFALDNWTEVRGVKFPQLLKNVGPNEEFRVENIQIGAPNDSLFVKQIIEN